MSRITHFYRVSIIRDRWSRVPFDMYHRNELRKLGKLDAYKGQGLSEEHAQLLCERWNGHNYFIWYTISMPFEVTEDFPLRWERAMILAYVVRNSADPFNAFFSMQGLCAALTGHGSEDNGASELALLREIHAQ